MENLEEIDVIEEKNLIRCEICVEERDTNTIKIKVLNDFIINPNHEKILIWDLD